MSSCPHFVTPDRLGARAKYGLKYETVGVMILKRLGLKISENLVNLFVVFKTCYAV